MDISKLKGAEILHRHNLANKMLIEIPNTKAHLLRAFHLPSEVLHASLIERYLKCGKANCRCHTDGPKHGPFFYLNRCFAKGQMQSLLLKSPSQIDQARQSVAAYAQVQQALDQISQINHELLRRGETLVAAAG